MTIERCVATGESDGVWQTPPACGPWVLPRILLDSRPTRCREPLAWRLLQGEAGTGNVVEAVRHARAVQGAIRQLQTMDDDELYVYAKVRWTRLSMSTVACRAFCCVKCVVHGVPCAAIITRPLC